MNVLTTLFLVDVLPAWTANLTRRETSRGKAYVSDSALALRLARTQATRLLALDAREHLGQLLEALVAEELTKQRGWSATEFDLFHYRESGGLEVDLVVETGDGRVFGIEVKAAQTVSSRHFAALRHFRDKVGKRFAGGVVLSLTRQGASFGDGIWALPLSALWEMAPSWA
jgi:predicted AAA+ superfamily ATPase